MEERRKNARLPLRFDAMIAMAGGTLVGKTKNISFGGALIELDHPVRVEAGQACTLSIVLQEVPERIAIELSCQTVHADSSCVGVTFLAVPGQSYGHLKNVLVLNSDDPGALLEELRHHPGILRDE